MKHLPKDEMFKLVSLLYEVVPPVLLETGKVKRFHESKPHFLVLLRYHRCLSYCIGDTDPD